MQYSEYPATWVKFLSNSHPKEAFEKVITTIGRLFGSLLARDHCKAGPLLALPVRRLQLRTRKHNTQAAPQSHVETQRRSNGERQLHWAELPQTGGKLKAGKRNCVAQDYRFGEGLHSFSRWFAVSAP